MSNPIRFERRVTRRQWPSLRGSAYGAFMAAGVMRWPHEDETPAKVRYKHIEDEILDRTFELAHDALVRAFVAAATEIVGRERAAQRRRKRRV